MLSGTSAGIVAALFVIAPTPLLRIFTDDPVVLSIGVTVLLLCAAFQFFDGFQAVATGALRGLGNTRTPMLVNFVGHWLIGLPIAYALCFPWGWGVVGLWSGLSLSLMLIGLTLLIEWYRRSSKLLASVPARL
jgi:MATE family multidrug resistance protein